jgi:hypothetical protein
MKARMGIPSLVAMCALAFPIASDASAQSNFINFNNGSEFVFVLPGMSSAAGNPNLYYRCYPASVLYPPIGEGPTSAALDITGWQWAGATTNAGATFGTPLFYFLMDPGLTCLLSAATGGGFPKFPPNKAKILASANLLAAYYFYTSIACAFPVGLWFSFAPSAQIVAPNPAANQGNLICGWSDKNVTTTLSFQYVTGSGDESAAARSRSYVNLNAAGLAIDNMTSAVEWEMEIAVDEPVLIPEAWVGGSYDSGGTSGYSPRVGTGAKLRFRVQDTSSAGLNAFGINVFNLTFQLTNCQVPGVTIFGAHTPSNIDTAWILSVPLLLGGIYTPLSGIGPFWNPNAGWTPGGESISPASLPISAPGLIGLRTCPATYNGCLVPPCPSGPIVSSGSNGSQVGFR